LTTYSSSPSGAVILTAMTDFFWADKVDGYSVGDYKTNAFSTTSTKVIFDSGTSLAYIPSSIASSVITSLLMGVTNTYYSGIYYIDCGVASTGKSLYLSIEGNWFEIPASTYVVKLTDQYGDYCILGFL